MSAQKKLKTSTKGGSAFGWKNSKLKTEKKRKKINAEELRQKLKLKHMKTKQELSEKYPKADKFFKSKNLDVSKVRQHSAKLLSAGAITGAFLLTSPSNFKLLPSFQDLYERYKTHKKVVEIQRSNKLIVDTLSSVLPERPRPLDRSEEKFLEQIFSNVIGIPARATLEGEHLNTTYGYIGAEQHLKRYPGDTLSQHGEGDVLTEGIAPGLGAWRYFANSKEELTPSLEETERWYAVVQTLYLPDWNTRTRYLREWYKYRKVLIVNTDNGQAVVASIADSGPAAWTGKHFGGSPEVMDYLGGQKYKKGPVVLFFVDDPENKVPLGPVEYD
ncbi:hypothetical protein KKB40_04140 [Patescibacteria group bacterium]|nr:hypothetical protein [Patescibacteria group bacterium]